MMKLTSRETEVMFLLCHGHSNKECAELMGCSIKTVEKHRNAIYYKWGVNNITAMIRVALRDHHMALDFFLDSSIGENCRHLPPQSYKKVPV